MAAVHNINLPAPLAAFVTVPLRRASGLPAAFTLAEVTGASQTGFIRPISQLDGPASSSSSADSFPPASGGSRSQNRLRLILEDVRMEIGSFWRSGVGALTMIRSALRNTG